MIQRNFWRNVLPSVIAFAFSGVYSIVDGMFVGQGVGDAGWPPSMWPGRSPPWSRP